MVYHTLHQLSGTSLLVNGEGDGAWEEIGRVNEWVNDTNGLLIWTL
jgi:hypothetical protein